MTKLQPAPDAVLHLVKCGCGKDRCSNNRCSCRKAGLTCTDLCTCNNDETGEACENVERIDDENSDDTSDEQEDVPDSEIDDE